MANSIISKPDVLKKCKKSKTTPKDLCEALLANRGLLPLPLVPLPLNDSPLLQSMEGIYFHYTLCNPTDPDDIRKSGADSLIANLSECDVEIWTDGSIATLAR